MQRKEYSAGAVKTSFWFLEFRKMIVLLLSGKSVSDIKQMNQDENIFNASTKLRSNQIFSTVSGRIQSLDSSFYPLFLCADVTTQKLFALVAAMSYDTLFFDFVYEVIREKMIMGSDTLTDGDIRIFFKDKQLQDRKVAQWTDETLHRLGACYKSMLCEAGMTDRGKGERKIIKPILDPDMERWLVDHDMGVYANALAGVR